MKPSSAFIIASSLCLCACSSRESYQAVGRTYAVDDKNIALLEWLVLADRPPMGHGAGKTLKRALTPFIYSRAKGVLKFERYCTTTQLKDPTSNAEDASQQSVNAVEKSCGLKGVKVVDRGIAGFPHAKNNIHDGVSFSAMVMSPKTGKWEQQILFIDKPSTPFWW